MFEMIVAQAILDGIKEKIDLFVTVSQDSNYVNGSSIVQPATFGDVHHVDNTHLPTSSLTDPRGATSVPKGCPAPAGCPGVYDSAKAEWHCCPVDTDSGTVLTADQDDAALSGADFWKGTWNPEYKWSPLVIFFTRF